MKVESTTATSIGSCHAGEPSRAAWFPSIEALRGFAAVAVLGHHIRDLAGIPSTKFDWLLAGAGSWGVNLFFALSAFLLADRFWRPMTGRDVAAFYIRRLYRIAPAYYAMLAILVMFFASPELVQSRFGAKQLLADITFMTWLSPHTTTNFNVNGVLWTLTLEILLYISLPFLSWLIGRRPYASASLLIGVGIGYRFWTAHWAGGLFDYYFGPGARGNGIAHFYVEHQYPGILPIFVLGIFARWMVEKGPLTAWAERPMRFGTFWPVVISLIPSVIVLRGVFRGVDYRHTIWYALFDIAMTLLFVLPLWLSVKPTSRSGLGLGAHVGNWLGVRSYSIYLWHFPIILVVFGRGPMTHAALTDHRVLRVLATVLVTLTVAHACYLLVERPGIRRGQTVVRRIMAGREAATIEAPAELR